MSYSTGSRSAATEAASWVFAGACIVVSIVYFNELKALMSSAMGLEPPAIQAAYSPAPAIDNKPRRATSRQPQQISSGGYRVELVAGPDGHFHAEAQINGAPAEVMVDTGATSVALPEEVAARAGIFVNASDYKYTSRTANGIARIAVVTLDSVSIGGIEVRNVRATVHQRGTLSTVLLGMSFIGQLHRAEMKSGRLILEN